MVDSSFSFQAVATIKSPFREKFAIPRQPGLATAAKGQVIFQAPYNHAEMVRGLEQFSHLWLLFIFHQTAEQGWKPLIRPPRLGGNKKLGVLASRSTFRPNPIGMSVVKLEKITTKQQQVILDVSGLDLLDQTPIVDIKPYIPYSDSLPDVQAGYAQQAPDHLLEVSFDDIALNQLKRHQQKYPELIMLIEQVLAQDPRPAYKKQQLDDKCYGMQLYDFNINWRLIDINHILVTDVTLLNKPENS